MGKKSGLEQGSKLGRTTLVACTCTNAFQDKTYGNRRRVANRGKSNKLSCTSCGREHVG